MILCVNETDKSLINAEKNTLCLFVHLLKRNPVAFSHNVSRPTLMSVERLIG